MNDVTKLPKWAQDHIQKIQYQRDAAVRALNTFTDGSTKSHIWIEDYACTGEKTGPVEKRSYIQANAVTFLLGKEEITIRLPFEEERGLKICAGWNGLVMKPSASNVIEILEERR
jgi:hypothetical protein